MLQLAPGALRAVRDATTADLANELDRYFAREQHTQDADSEAYAWPGKRARKSSTATECTATFELLPAVCVVFKQSAGDTNDTIRGDALADVINGGAGNNRLVGGTGKRCACWPERQRLHSRIGSWWGSDTFGMLSMLEPRDGAAPVQRGKPCMEPRFARDLARSGLVL